MQLAWSVLAVLEVVYVIVFSVWIIYQRKRPISTLAWILFVAAVPIAGAALYAVIGPRRLRRSRMKRLRAQGALHRPQLQAHEALFGAEIAREMARQVSRIGERSIRASVAAARSWQLLIDGIATYDALVAAIDAATHHVHALWYIFEPDVTGTRIRDALTRAAQRGVQVRLLVDAVGSGSLSNAFLKPLRDAGGEVERFNRWRIERHSRLLNYRNHRKILVCDGDVAFTGGINITDTENEDVRGDAAYRDTHLKLEGNAAHGLNLVFLEDWFYACGRAVKGPEYFPMTEFDPSTAVPVQILDSGPDLAIETIKTAFFAAIGSAKQRVYLTTAYFVPDDTMLMALQAAALRGVDVRVLVSRESDSRTVMAAQRSYFDELVQNQVRIFEYLPRMLHAKTLVVDDWFAVVGTSNFDNRSFRLNFEVVAIVYGSLLAAELAQVFETDLASAEEITSKSRAHMLVIPRFYEAVARLFAPLF